MKSMSIFATVALLGVTIWPASSNATTYTLNLTNNYSLPTANTIMLFFATVNGVSPTLDLPFTSTGAVGGAAITAGNSGMATYNSDSTYTPGGTPAYGYGTTTSPQWSAPSTLTIKAFEFDYTDPVTKTTTFSSLIVPGSVSNKENTFTITYTPITSPWLLFASGLTMLLLILSGRNREVRTIPA